MGFSSYYLASESAKALNICFEQVLWFRIMLILYLIFHKRLFSALCSGCYLFWTFPRILNTFYFEYVIWQIYSNLGFSYSVGKHVVVLYLYIRKQYKAFTRAIFHMLVQNYRVCWLACFVCTNIFSRIKLKIDTCNR